MNILERRGTFVAAPWLGHERQTCPLRSTSRCGVAVQLGETTQPRSGCGTFYIDSL